MLVASFFLLMGPAVAVEPNHPYRQHWKKATYGRNAVIGVTAKATFGQIINRPSQYGRGAAGFGKRMGFGFATHAVKTTVEHVVAAPLHEDLHYHRSTDPRFGPRIRHALVSTVVTQNTHTGKRVPAMGRLSGNAAAGTFAALVVPAASGASTAGLGLAADAGANVVREFWPRKHR